MHHAREKVLIYTVFVLSLTRWTTSTPPAQSESCEEHLAKEVIIYRNLINSMSGIDDDSPDDNSGCITQEVIRSLEYNVRFVLKLAADFYEWSMTSWVIIAETAADVDHKIEVWRVGSMPKWQPFETIVCSFVPSLLAFIYTFTNDTSGYVQLHRSHSLLCSVMPSMEEISSPDNMVQSVYLCDAKTLTQLLNIKVEFPDNSTSIEYHPYFAEFVKRAFELKAGVDKKLMLTTLLYSVDTRRNLFMVPWDELYRERTNRKQAGNLGTVQLIDLNKRLWKVNQYLETRTRSKPNGKMPVPDKVNWLVANAFKTLVPHFGRVVRGKFDNNEWTFSRNALIQWLFIALSSLCDRTPLVLAYLADYCSLTVETTVPFGLYLTLCGDWKGFLEVQCPGTLDVADERACVENAIADRLLVNFYRVTGDVSGFDDASSEVETSWFGNTNKASVYINGLYEKLSEFYSEPNDKFPLWTTSDWLTGKQLLADRCQDRWRPTCSLRDQMITLSGNGGQSEAEVPLWEAYSLLLPWHSDERNVFTFHAVLFGYAYRTMNDFVFRHAEIVSMFLRHLNWPLELMLSNPLENTFGWYLECAKRFYYYMSMPGPREPIKAWKFKDLLLAAVENFKQTDYVSFVDKNATTVPSENLADPSVRSEHHLSSFGELDYVGNLNRMLENNCGNAVEYVNEFIRIAQASKVTRWNHELLEGDHCNQFVSNVLVKFDM